jgi:hypothetical protein
LLPDRGAHIAFTAGHTDFHHEAILKNLETKVALNGCSPPGEFLRPLLVHLVTSFFSFYFLWAAVASVWFVFLKLMMEFNPHGEALRGQNLIQP